MGFSIHIVDGRAYLRIVLNSVVCTSRKLQWMEDIVTYSPSSDSPAEGESAGPSLHSTGKKMQTTDHGRAVFVLWCGRFVFAPVSFLRT